MEDTLIAILQSFVDDLREASAKRKVRFRRLLLKLADSIRELYGVK